MSEAVFIAAVGFGGAIAGALLVAFLQPAWANWIGPKSRLEVKVCNSSFSLPLFFKTALESYLWTYDPRFRLKPEVKEKFALLARRSGHTRVEIKNNSIKSINDIALSADNHSEILFDVQINGESHDTLLGKICEIGTLRPSSTCVIDFWTGFDYSDSSWFSRDSFVEVTAAEYDRIRVRYPPPEYIRSENILIKKKLLWRTFWTFLFGYLILLIYASVFDRWPT